GNGQLGPTWLAGTIAPGHSIGRLTIAGDYVQQPGSVYEAEVDPSGRSDLLQVQGRAHLQGGTLRLVPTSAGALLGQRWRVLAAHNVEGRFAAVEGALASPFLAFAARYEGNAIQAQVGRGLPLASAARTRNQRGVAGAVDHTPDGHVLPQRLTQLQPAQVPAALDAVSGELHASVRTLLLQDTQGPREAALARARHGQDAFTAQSAAGRGHGLWADVRQDQHRLDGDGNAGSARLSGSTALVGYDQAFDSGWQAGLFGGGGKRTAQLSARYDRAEIKATHAGLHVSQRWGQLGVRAGLVHSWQQVRSRRQVPEAGQAEDTAAQARYEVNTSQWFVELGYRWEHARGGIEPFLQYTGLRLRSDAAQEQGGQAALAVATAKQAVGQWSGGLRFGFDLAARGQVQDWLSLRGSLAYQQANGDLTPSAQMQWQQGPGFTVWGAPLAKHSTLASLGVAARLSENSLLELNWHGAFASHARDNSLGLRYSMRF
ncbi:MAG TPA: autotransporter domain-containing protein, partial [Stenotrophomonas sp.]|nr:autotransporter domain-containing protein [Stenotrophomonas sp.]